MSIDYPYTATVDEIIKDLQQIKKKHGGGINVMLPDPGWWDPLFEGHGSRLMAELRENHRGHGKCVVIVEKSGLDQTVERRRRNKS